jgi:hypothetical protein
MEQLLDWELLSRMVSILERTAMTCQSHSLAFVPNYI